MSIQLNCWRRLVLGLLMCSVGSVRVSGGSDPVVTGFAAQRRQQTEELAAKLHVDVPPEIRTFFQAAEAGDAKGVSNCYAHIQRLAGREESDLNATGVINAGAEAFLLGVPVHETRNAYEVFELWDAVLLQKYAKGILDSIPAGSVYFGGTDEGRFAITMFRDVAQAPDIFIVTQNGLSDRQYTDYLRLTYGDRLWLTSTNDEKSAFQACLKDITARQQRGEPPNPEENVVSTNGFVFVTGAKGVMAMNGILTKQVFEHNKATHGFFVEESYAIPWMYPCLEPHGLILKLNKEPLDNLGPAIIACDREYWDKLTKALLADPRFLKSDAARKTYAKLRSAIAGVYAYRKLYAEAEYVFRQALRLAPDSAKAKVNLSRVLVCEADSLYKNDPARAESALREAIQLESGFAAAYNNLGYLLVKDANRWMEAENLIRKAIELPKPQLVDAYCWGSLAELLANQPGRRQEAFRPTRRASQDL